MFPSEKGERICSYYRLCSSTFISNIVSVVTDTHSLLSNQVSYGRWILYIQIRITC